MKIRKHLKKVLCLHLRRRLSSWQSAGTTARIGLNNRIKQT